VHHDTSRYDLRVKTVHGYAVIGTTTTHLFWDPYHHYWVPANKLSKGEHLKTANGTVAVADGGATPVNHDGWMWDLTVPGNNDHDFYVVTTAVAVLVHNCGPEDLNYNQIRERIDSHTWPTHGFGTQAEGTKFAENIDQQSIFQGLVERIGPDNETGVVDNFTGNHEHIIPWPGAGANGENFVRAWMTPRGGLGGIWPIEGP